MALFLARLPEPLRSQYLEPNPNHEEAEIYPYILKKKFNTDASTANNDLKELQALLLISDRFEWDMDDAENLPTLKPEFIIDPKPPSIWQIFLKPILCKVFVANADLSPPAQNLSLIHI